MTPLSVIMIGAGERGLGVYSDYVKENPNDYKFTHIVEPNFEKRKAFAKIHKIKAKNQYETLDQIDFEDTKIDFAINATPDIEHFKTTNTLLTNKIPTLLEKPIGITYNECAELEKISKKHNTELIICHVLRYSPFYQTIKKIIKKIGYINHIKQVEIIGIPHFTHSYVRGKWRNSKKSGPISLTKTCHDFDIIQWFANSTPLKITSYSAKSEFINKIIDKTIPDYCLQGCPIEKTCPYNSKKIYLNNSEKSWMHKDLVINPTKDGIKKALLTTNYGKCVYKLDNNVPDNQNTNILFKNSITGELIMLMTGAKSNRKIVITGTKGVIRGNLREGIIYLNNEIIKLEKSNSHGYGDRFMLKEFVRSFKANKLNKLPTTISRSLISHKLAFLAEESRKSNELLIFNETI